MGSGEHATIFCMCAIFDNTSPYTRSKFSNNHRLYRDTMPLNQLPTDIEKLVLFHFLSHICACTHTYCYTFACTNRHTQTCTCGTHTNMHMHMLTHVHLAGQIAKSPGGYEVILDKCMYPVKIHIISHIG